MVIFSSYVKLPEGTLVSWWKNIASPHTKMLPCCWNGARIFSNICSKNGPAIAASMPHPHCMEHMGRHSAIQGFMVGSSHSALHKATILKYAPLLDKPTGLHLIPNNGYILYFTYIRNIRDLGLPDCKKWIDINEQNSIATLLTETENDYIVSKFANVKALVTIPKYGLLIIALLTLQKWSNK